MATSRRQAAARRSSRRIRLIALAAIVAALPWGVRALPHPYSLGSSAAFSAPELSGPSSSLVSRSLEGAAASLADRPSLNLLATRSVRQIVARNLQALKLFRRASAGGADGKTTVKRAGGAWLQKRDPSEEEEEEGGEDSAHVERRRGLTEVVENGHVVHFIYPHHLNRRSAEHDAELLGNPDALLDRREASEAGRAEQESEEEDRLERRQVIIAREENHEEAKCRLRNKHAIAEAAADKHEARIVKKSWATGPGEGDGSGGGGGVGMLERRGGTKVKTSHKGPKYGLVGGKCVKLVQRLHPAP